MWVVVAGVQQIASSAVPLFNWNNVIQKCDAVATCQAATDVIDATRKNVGAL
jgi:hypothetical protein